MIDLSTAKAPDVGRALREFGINLLVRRIERTVPFLVEVLGFAVIRQSAGFALLRHGGMVLQLHEDATYAANPLLGLLPEAGARGAGVELRLFECDPDQAEARARLRDDVILREARDMPAHGLRECILLDPDGYAWVPSRRLQP